MAGKPNPKRKNMIIAEYERQTQTGKPNFTLITRNVGLKSTTGSYAKRVIQRYLEVYESKEPKGQRRECIGWKCGSTGKNNRMCDACRFNGEYMAPFPISPSIHQVGRAW